MSSSDADARRRAGARASLPLSAGHSSPLSGWLQASAQQLARFLPADFQTAQRWQMHCAAQREGILTGPLVRLNSGGDGYGTEMPARGRSQLLRGARLRHGRRDGRAPPASLSVGHGRVVSIDQARRRFDRHWSRRPGNSFPAYSTEQAAKQSALGTGSWATSAIVEARRQHSGSCCPSQCQDSRRGHRMRSPRREVLWTQVSGCT